MNKENPFDASPLTPEDEHHAHREEYVPHDYNTRKPSYPVHKLLKSIQGSAISILPLRI